MLTTYRHAQEVTVQIPCVDLAGDPIAPISASYRLLDKMLQEIAPATALPDVTAGTEVLSVTIGAAANTLTSGRLRDVRVVEVSIQTEGGTVVATARYAIEADNTFSIMVNTFQTFEEAELNAMEMSGLVSWDGKAEPQKRAALADAFINLCKLKFHVPGMWAQNRIHDYWINRIGHLQYYSAAEFQALDPLFVNAVKKAQVAEADVLLNGDPNGKLRREGVISYTIGESSQFFRPAKPLDLPISPQAVKYLQGYLNWSKTLVRG